MSVSGSTVAIVELGKLLNALKVAGTRTAFKNGTDPPGVNIGAIPAPVVAHLQNDLSENELAVLAEINTLHLTHGLACGDQPGIAAV